MVEPISPKTIVPRSLATSKLEQSRKMRPEVQHSQMVQDLQKNDVKRQQRVNKPNQAEYKRINEEEDESNKKNNDGQQGDEEECSKEDKKEEMVGRGNYIDIKV